MLNTIYPVLVTIDFTKVHTHKLNQHEPKSIRQADVLGRFTIVKISPCLSENHISSAV